MDYVEFRIVSEALDPEILLAYLSQLPFDSFEEHSKGWSAYLPAKASAVKEIEEALKQLQGNLSFQYEIHDVPGKNWNAEWEANFQPIQVGSFCGVRAEFHPPFSEVDFDLLIQPRMAFGTGHHATTYMMIAMMENGNFSDSRVLDYGCGTGILAILASKMGAADIQAIDIEQAAYDNTLSNCAANAVDNGSCSNNR